MSNTSFRILARTLGSQPRAAHLSSKTWVAIARHLGTVTYYGAMSKRGIAASQIVD